MEREQTVGVFHRNECNRKGLIKLLSSEFDCVEIEQWEDVATANVETMIIGEPELWYPEMSFEAMTEVIVTLRSNVLMLNYSKRHWWIFRSNYVQLRNPTEEQVKMKLKEIRPNKGKAKRFQMKWLRA